MYLKCTTLRNNCFIPCCRIFRMGCLHRIIGIPHVRTLMYLILLLLMHEDVPPIIVSSHPVCFLWACVRCPSGDSRPRLVHKAVQSSLLCFAASRPPLRRLAHKAAQPSLLGFVASLLFLRRTAFWHSCGRHASRGSRLKQECSDVPLAAVCQVSDRFSICTTMDSKPHSMLFLH